MVVSSIAVRQTLGRSTSRVYGSIIIIGLSRCVAMRVAYVDGRTDGQARVVRQARAAGGERRPAAGQNRRLGRRWASQNRDVTPEAWLTRTDG